MNNDFSKKDLKNGDRVKLDLGMFIVQMGGRHPDRLVSKETCVYIEDYMDDLSYPIKTIDNNILAVYEPPLLEEDILNPLKHGIPLFERKTQLNGWHKMTKQEDDLPEFDYDLVWFKDNTPARGINSDGAWMDYIVEAYYLDWTTETPSYDEKFKPLMNYAIGLGWSERIDETVVFTLSRNEQTFRIGDRIILDEGDWESPEIIEDEKTEEKEDSILDNPPFWVKGEDVFIKGKPVCTLDELAKHLTSLKA